MHAIKQVKTVNRTIGSVLRAKAFREGYEEALNGLPMDPNKYSGHANDCWQYERGRQFAFIFNGRLKSGNRLSYQAIHVFGNAVARGLII